MDTKLCACKLFGPRNGPLWNVATILSSLANRERSSAIFLSWRPICFRWWEVWRFIQWSSSSHAHHENRDTRGGLPHPNDCVVGAEFIQYSGEGEACVRSNSNLAGSLLPGRFPSVSV